MKKVDWLLALRYWRYCECSTRNTDGEYNPMDKYFLQNMKPYRFIRMEVEHDFGYAAFTSSELIINFAGSDDIFDWVNNIRRIKNYRDDVHNGFYYTAKKFREQVKELVEEYIIDRDDPKIVICGHSRGGAIAKEIARYISKNLYIKVSLYTYGSPKIGGKKYRTEVSGLPITSYHFCNGGDPVPNVPKCGFVKEHNRIVINNNWWKRMMFWKWIDRHCNYLEPLLKKFKKQIGYKEIKLDAMFD